MKPLKNIKLATALPWLLLIGGTLGVLCSLILMIEKMDVLANPSYRPICDLNPILNCKSVMTTPQSRAFGFDNTLLGLVWFAALATSGMAVLAGAKLKRWYWLGLQVGLTSSLLFVHWLIYNILYVIHSLCPFCIVVWIVTIGMFWYLTLYNLQSGNIITKGKLTTVAAFAQKHHLDILLLWFLVILILVLKQFWYYYGPKLGL